MSIGVLQGTTADNEEIVLAFEAYYYGADTSALIAFNASRILTIDNFQRGSEGRWATHEIIGTDNKPVMEFLGPNLEKIDFTMFLSVSLGVVPETELQKLRTLRDTGTVCTFILGNKPLGDNSWIVKSVSEAHENKNASGQTTDATANVSLAEYVEDVSSS